MAYITSFTIQSSVLQAPSLIGCTVVIGKLSHIRHEPTEWSIAFRNNEKISHTCLQTIEHANHNTIEGHLMDYGDRNLDEKSNHVCIQTRDVVVRTPQR